MTATTRRPSFPGRETAEDDRDGVSRASRVAVRRVGRVRRGTRAPRRASAKNDDRGESSGGGYAVSFGAVVATALSCALAGGVAGYFIPKKHQSRSAAWRYESVAGESDRPTETEFREPLAAVQAERARSRAERTCARWSSACDERKIVRHTKGVCYA